MKIIISTGLGRLHLTQSAQALSKLNIDIEVMQGWVPHFLPDKLINLLGKIIGSKHLAAGMKKRQLTFLDPQKNHSTAWPEFLAQFLFKLSNAKIIKRGRAAKIAWQAFGWSSKKFIGNHDVFHVRSGAGRGGAIKKARVKGCKVVVDHSIAHPAFMERALQDDYARFSVPFWMGPDDVFWKSILDDCIEGDLILVNSDFVKESFIEQGFLPSSIAVAYLGVREDFFNLKENYNTTDSLKLLFTGGFGIRKGAQYLVPALEILDEEGIDFCMTVVGANNEAKPIISKSSLHDKILCMGFIPQDDLKKHLEVSDIYVFPSLAEGCASSGMEAMAAGLPVIATYESGLPIRHGENGWIIPAKSDKAIVEAIKILARDKTLREKLGKAAAKTISENYTWSDYAKNVKNVYSSLLSVNENI